jgi:hypothetical protein
LTPVRQIKAEHLIAAARFLIEHHPAGGRPIQAYLRRAVSSAYYALFHYLCWEATRQLLPGGPTDDRLALARSTDHEALRTVCGWVANPMTAPLHVRPIATRLGATPGILSVALTFPDLQQARHEADYDHFGGFSKPAAIQYVDAAEAAIRGMRYQKTPKKQAFFALVALKIKKVH